MKSFLIKSFFFICPVLLVVVAVNYYGDAARLFAKSYEKRMVEIINSGKSVTNISNYDERAFQKELINTSKIKPEIVVIGSSKSLLIDSNFFKGHVFMNNSMAGGDLNDITSIYWLNIKNNKIPKKIILGLDPWMLNEDRKQYDLMSNLVKVHKNNDERNGRNKYLSLISLSYFQNSLKMIPLRLTGRDQPIPATKDNNRTNTRNPDGSLTYSKTYRESSALEVRERVNVYLKRGDIANIELLNSVSKNKLNKLEMLINDIQKRKIELILLLTPYHPLVYQKIENKYPNTFNPEEVIYKLAKAKKIKLYGSFDPKKCGLSERQFYDAIHCNEEGMRMIFKEGTK